MDIRSPYRELSYFSCLTFGVHSISLTPFIYPAWSCIFDDVLNDYHLQFLHKLHNSAARYLIVGGQARHFHDGSATRDLDLWVDIGALSVPALEAVLRAWSAEHPLHTSRPLAGLLFQPGRQLKFPDADCWFVARSGEPTEILATDCIDILTSVGQHDFNVFHGRAETHDVDGMDLRVLARDDASVISPAK